jgi:hypothetical protein
MEQRLEEAKKIVEEMNRDAAIRKIEELIKDNMIEFTYKEKQYRVRLLNLSEKEELDMLRRKKFGQLMQDKDIMMAKDLIRVYKERGIDIEELNEQIKKLDAEEKDLMLSLGESLSKNEGDKVLASYEEKVQAIRIQRQVLFTQKTLMLDYSLENQLENYVYQIITYLASEVKDGNEWKKVFSSMEEFKKFSDEALISQLGQYSVLLQTF